MSPVSEEKPLIGDDLETQLSGKLPLRTHTLPGPLTNPRDFQRDGWASLSMTL